MECDDEWITEVEEPYLAGDTSWMDVHECFEESSTSNKRKRGPRNLNVIANKKGKQKLIDDDDDEVEYISDEEEEEAEFVEDDRDSDEEDVNDFDDLGIDEDEDE
ncbi:hypothetical protein OROGR_020177 [Orobanche gracilis]